MKLKMTLFTKQLSELIICKNDHLNVKKKYFSRLPEIKI